MRWIVLSIAALGLLLIPAGLAQQDTQMNNETEITILAPEECDGEDGMFGDDENDQNQQTQNDQNQTQEERCLEVDDGSLADIEEGSDVLVTFQNEDNVTHTLHVAEMNDSDSMGGTDEADAIASSQPTDTGEETTFTFTSPVAGDELYFWGEGYEEDGMWVTADEGDAQREPVPGEPGEPGGPDEPEPGTDDTPLPAAVALAAVGIAAAAFARR